MWHFGYLCACLFSITMAQNDATISNTQTNLLPDKISRAIDQCVADLMQTQNLSGVSLAIAKDGQFIYVKSYGYANRDTQQPLTPDNEMRIASSSKSVTSMMVMRLVDQGFLTLDQRVFGFGAILGTTYGTKPYSDYLREITVRHLLQHTAGAWGISGDDPANSNPQMDIGRFLTWVLDTYPVLNKPGTKSDYSNVGYLILGQIIAKLTNQPYEMAVAEMLLKPLNIQTMHIGRSAQNGRFPNEVTYYSSGDGNPYDPMRMSSDGGWVCTAKDLVTLIQRFDGLPNPPDFIASITLAQMLMPTQASPDYGLGWNLSDGGRSWSHCGSIPGTGSGIARTKQGISYAGITNGDENDCDLENLIFKIEDTIRTWPTKK